VVVVAFFLVVVSCVIIVLRISVVFIGICFCLIMCFFPLFSACFLLFVDYVCCLVYIAGVCFCELLGGFFCAE